MPFALPLSWIVIFSPHFYPGLRGCFPQDNSLFAAVNSSLVTVGRLGFSGFMLDTLQKILLTGIGATALTAEKVESALKDLVEKGKLSAEEAKETADRITAEMRRDFQDAKGDLQQSYAEVLKKANLVTREDWNTLEKRVQELEARLAAREHPPNPNP